MFKILTFKIGIINIVQDYKEELSRSQKEDHENIIV